MPPMTKRCAYIGDGDGCDDGGQQVKHDDEAHGETAEAAKLVKEDKFAQVGHGRVDPAATLRQQDLPVVGSNRERMGIANELSLEEREVLEQESRQVTIFSEMQQVLHVQRVDAILRIVLDKLVADEQRLVCVRRPETIERETTGQTGDGSE